MTTPPPIAVFLPCVSKLKLHYGNEIHRMYDFQITSQAVRSCGTSVHLTFDLGTSGIGPLDRRLVRASLLLNGMVMLSDIRWSGEDRCFEIPHTRNGRFDQLRLAFSTDLLPLAASDNYLVVRVVSNTKLGTSYQVNAWVYADAAPAPLEYHFFRERGPTKISLENPIETVPLRYYNFITQGPPTRGA